MRLRYIHKEYILIHNIFLVVISCQNPRPSNFIRLMLADPEELKGGETWGSFLPQQCSSVADWTRAGTGYSKYNPRPPMAKTRWCQPELDLLRGLWGGHDMMTPLMPLITEMFHEVILKASFLPLVLSTAQSFEEKSLVQSSASSEVEISLHHQALHLDSDVTFIRYKHFNDPRHSSLDQFSNLMLLGLSHSHKFLSTSCDQQVRALAKWWESFGQRVKVRFKSFLVPVQDPDLKENTAQYSTSQVAYTCIQHLDVKSHIFDQRHVWAHDLCDMLHSIQLCRI